MLRVAVPSTRIAIAYSARRRDIFVRNRSPAYGITRMRYEPWGDACNIYDMAAIRRKVANIAHVKLRYFDHLGIFGSFVQSL